MAVTFILADVNTILASKGEGRVTIPAPAAWLEVLFSAAAAALVIHISDGIEAAILISVFGQVSIVLIPTTLTDSKVRAIGDDANIVLD